MGIAHELITRGWSKGVTEADDGSVCLTGAAMYAHLGYAERHRMDWALPEHVRRVLQGCIPPGAAATRGDGTPIIFSFNDRAESFDEVLRVAKEADEILDAR